MIKDFMGEPTFTEGLTVRLALYIYGGTIFFTSK